MNKEENIDYINSIHDSYIKELQKQDECIKQLQQQNKKYKEVIDKVRNNLEKDISVIKNVKMSNKEIICRLEETNKMLKEVSE